MGIRYRLSGWPRLRAWWQAKPTVHLQDRLLVEQKKAAWGHFAADVTAEQKRLLAERRRA